MGVITFFYLLISIVCYQIYKKDTHNDITDGFDFEGVATKIILGFITGHVLSASPLYLSTVQVDFENYLNITVEKLGKVKEFLYRTAMRASLIVVLTTAAAFVPYFESVVGIIGSIGNGFIVFLVPVACYAKIFGWRNLRIWQYIIFGAIFALGLFCTIYGGYDSINGLREKIQKGPKNLCPAK